MKLKFDIFWQTLHHKQKFLTILLPLYPSDAYNRQATTAKQQYKLFPIGDNLKTC